MKDMMIAAKKMIKVTQDDVDDIVTTALEGGITYWCDEAKVVGDYLGECSSDQISRGGSLMLRVTEPFDDNDTEWYKLSLNELLDGIRRFYNDYDDDIMWDEVDGHIEIDPSEVDAESADAIVQNALFGEIVFG